MIGSKIKIIIKWLKQSDLKVNESKTEPCLFHRKDTPPITININNDQIKSVNVINILDVLFDSKLTWASHVSSQTNKANKAIHKGDPHGWAV